MIGLCASSSFISSSLRARQRQRQIFQSNHRVVHAGQPESLAILFKTHPLIDQHRDSFGAEEVSNQSRIGPMIVIAQHRKDAVSRAQSAQHFGAGRGILAFFGNVIAGQRDDVGLQPVGCFDRAFDLFPAGEWTVVNIGELNDAKAVEARAANDADESVVLDCQPERLG